MKMFGLGILTTFIVTIVALYIASNDDEAGHWIVGLFLFIVTFLFGLGVGKNIL